MSPDFVLTALSTFCADDPLLITVATDQHLLGLGILQQNRRSLKFPFRSRRLFKTIHSFQSGILLRTGIADEAIDALLHELVVRGNTSVSFDDYARTTASATKLSASARRQNFQLFESRRYSRPILQLHETFDEWKAARVKLLKEADRQRRRLAELGRLSWQIILPDEVGEETTETFLTLEHNSWKGDSGTSLLSTSQDATFFRSLVSKLARREEVFFTELRLNDVAIASTVNFMSRGVAFAYKIAWDKKYSRFGPGVLNEISFVEYATSNELPYSYIESGTNSESFIARIWPGRISMSTGYVIGSRHAKLIVTVLSAARWAKELGRRLRSARSRRHSNKPIA